MSHYHFKALLQQTQWLTPAYVSTKSGKITSISEQPIESKQYEYVDGYALPGYQNAHSHAFQYAMAGIAEKYQSGTDTDDFWGWRQAMYQVALSVDPAQLEAITSMLYAEMARHGYTHVAEFHYLHHDKDGKPYAHLAEMGERLIKAAENAGIKITLIPMFYQQGGFGILPQLHQRRFISETKENYLQLLEVTQKVCEENNHANCGFGIHSLRAVTPEDISSSLLLVDSNVPVHIHISEQLKEIEGAIAFLGKRPVEWLLDNALVSANYHLVHATHLSAEEVTGIAQSGAHVVLCPTTEGNLGDGIFPLRSYQAQGGKWSIGTDSHVSLSPLEELRLLDYGQRLTSHKRNTFADQEQGDSARYAIQQATVSGRAAMGIVQEEYFAIGQPLDAVVYDASSPLISTSSIENVLSAILYSSDNSHTLGTLSNGKWIVKNNQHFKIENILHSFRKAIAQIKVR